MNPGIFEIPMSAYLADPCEKPSLSSGVAHRLITASPLHAYAAHPRLGGEPPEQSEKADIGSVAHDVLLHGEGTIAILEYDDWRTNASKEARAGARAEGKTPILAHNMPPVIAMVEAATRFIANCEVPDLLSPDTGKSEQTIVWQENEHCWARIRPDWLSNDWRMMCHYKTSTATTRPEPFIRGVMQSMGYGFTTRFYARGLQALSGVPADKCRHLILAQEQNSPYACALFALTPAKVAIEDARVARAIDLWSQCMREDHWPAYSGLIHYAEPTAWELAEAEGAAA